MLHLIDELPHDSSDGHLLATGDFGLHDQIFAPGHVIEVPIYFNQASNVYSIEGRLSIICTYIISGCSMGATVQQFYERVSYRK